MRNTRLRLALVLLFLGSIGILSLLSVDWSFPPEMDSILQQHYSKGQIKWLLLINPFIFLLSSVFMGVLLYDKMGYRLPIFENLIKRRIRLYNLRGILKASIIGGILAAILIFLVQWMFKAYLPSSLFSSASNISWKVRILYGGFSEEIMVRFGWMTFISWALYKIFGRLNKYIYEGSILLSALLFGLAHLSSAYVMTGKLTASTVLYILLGNGLPGIIFGWLYWRYGLESAIMAHIIAHFILILAG